MSLEDFQAGFWRAVLCRVEAVTDKAEVLAARPLVVSRIDTALATFYANNTTRIENARGVPGITDVSVSYQVGMEFGTLLMRQRASVADTADWGATLASRMVAAVADQARLRIRRAVNGSLTVDEVVGG